MMQNVGMKQNPNVQFKGIKLISTKGYANEKAYTVLTRILNKYKLTNQVPYDAFTPLPRDVRGLVLATGKKDIDLVSRQYIEPSIKQIVDSRLSSQEVLDAEAVLKAIEENKFDFAKIEIKK